MTRDYKHLQAQISRVLSGQGTEDDGTHLASTDPHGAGSSLPLHSSGIRLRSNMTSGSFPDP